MTALLHIISRCCLLYILQNFSGKGTCRTSTAQQNNRMHPSSHSLNHPHPVFSITHFYVSNFFLPYLYLITCYYCALLITLAGNKQTRQNHIHIITLHNFNLQIIFLLLSSLITSLNSKTQTTQRNKKRGKEA